MQRGALRRFSRRAQPGPVGAGHLLHTSVSATSSSSDPLPVDYLSALHNSIHLSQAEQDAWASSVLSVASLAQDAKSEARREALHEANRRMEQQRQEQEQILARREAERRARIAEREEQQRREDERLRQEQAEAEQRRREERAAAEEALRRAAVEAVEAERIRQERLRPCVICMDDSDLALMAQTPCGHWSCKTCLKEGFEASITSRSRYQCCQQHVSVSLIADLFEDDFTTRYDLMVLELTTPNPVYCADPACAAFIPPVNYFGPDSASCDRCLGDTCRHCRSIGHAGRGCTMDQATEQVRALAAVVGWKTCPACTTMVERRDGCLHMTCLCGAEFCYRCGGYWRQCSSRCGGQYF